MKRRIHILSIFYFLATLLCLGQLPRTTIESIYPPGGQKGTEIEIMIKGKENGDAQWLKFTHDGIKAEQIRNEKGGIETGRFKVRIGKEVQPGLYEVQLGGGRFGASNVGTFVVSPLPVILSPADNNSREKAFAIEQGTTISGKTVARKYTFFKFNAKKGQKLIIHCATEEIDSNLSPVLNVMDAQGNELASEGYSGILEFSPIADGEYYIKLYDFLYGGSELHYFQLTVSQRPHIDFVVPPIGKPGAKTRFTLFGRNLPDGQPSGLKLPNGREVYKKEVEIQLPANADEKDPMKLFGKVNPQQMLLPSTQYRLDSTNGPSNPILIGLSNEKIVEETTDNNDKPENSQAIEVPCEFVGKFYPYADKDYFHFEAKKDDTFWIEGFSERFGRPSNLFFLVQQVTKNDKGEEKVKDLKEVIDNPRKLGGQEFKTSTNDPIYRFVAPADSIYRVLIYDLFNSGTADIRNQYRVSIRKENPGFTLAAYIQSPPPPDNNSSPVAAWPASIRKGEILPIKVIADRRDNFQETIQLEIKGLPESVEWNPRKIPAKADSVSILLHAKEDAKSWSGRIQIIGKSKIEGKDVTRKCLPASIIRSTYDKQAKTALVQTRLMKALVLDVNAQEKSPVFIRTKEDKVWETCIHGSIKIPFLISQNDNGFKQNRKIKLRGHVNATKVKEVNLDTKKDEGLIDLNLTQFKLPVGEYPLYLSTLIKGKYKRATDETKKTAEETSKKAVEEAKIAAEATKKAEADYNAIKDKKEVPKEEKEKKRVAMDELKKKSISAEARMKEAQEVFKVITEENKPKDVNETFYSPPFVLRVTEAPIKLKSIQAIQIKAGEKINTKVSIERLYEFKDAVTLNLVLPKNLKGITLKKNNIEKEKIETELNLTAGPKVTAGDFIAKLEASVRVNNQTIKLSQEVNIKVEAAPEEKAKG
ncbi:MAG: hypothetical protein HOL08_06125 [Opitutae bacterium]|nr:hypothetical protein [Opitutae bacterium]